MATIEEAVSAKILATTAITALIGTRLFPLAIPQTAALPALSYQKISSPKTQSHSGSSHLAQSRIQFTCAALEYSSSKALATAVINCWNSFRGTVSGVRIDGCSIENDSDSEIDQAATVSPVVRIDVVIWHYE